MLSTILNDPLWTLAAAPSTCDVAPIPKDPLLTLTTGKVHIPRATSSDLLIIPSGRLENPICSTFIYSGPTFNTSLGWIELIPLRTNCVFPIPIAPSRLCSMAVNVIGCCTIPSKPMIVLDNFLVISNLWALPSPTPVKVTGRPEVIYSFRVKSSMVLALIALTNNVEGIISVTTPTLLIVDPIETAVDPTPTKVEPGV